MFKVTESGFETLIKTILPLINHLSVKLCWLLTTLPLHFIDVPHWFLINMFLHVSFSRCLQVLLYWCGYHAGSHES